MVNRRRARRRRLLLCAGTALAMVSAVPAWAAACEEEPVQHTYVANHWMWVIGPDLVAGVVAEETGVHTAPIGNVYLGASSSGVLDITVDDLNTTRGDIPLGVSQHAPNGSDRSGWLTCVPAGERTTIDGIRRGHHVELTVLNDAYGRQLCGGPGGTAGVLTVHP